MKDDNSEKKKNGSGVSRRSFLKGVGGVGLGTMALPSTGLIGTQIASAETLPTQPQVLSGTVPVQLKINGKTYDAQVETRATLLDTLRDHLDLTGSKLICDRGTCGGCSVIMDDKLVCSCMVLAIDAQGAEIRTIEGLAQGDNLHPVQEAFLECDALQCGFCTPGLVMACTSVLEKNPAADIDEIKHGISGNICRCGTYNRIFEAALIAKERMGAAGAKKS